MPGGPSRAFRGVLLGGVLRGSLLVIGPGSLGSVRRAEKPLGVVEVRLVLGSKAGEPSGVEERRSWGPFEPSRSRPPRALLGECSLVLVEGTAFVTPRDACIRELQPQPRDVPRGDAMERQLERQKRDSV